MLIERSMPSWSEYCAWGILKQRNCIAKQCLSEGVYQAYLSDDSVEKICIGDVTRPFACLIALRNPEQAEFFCPEYFAKLNKQNIYVPRGGFMIDPENDSVNVRRSLHKILVGRFGTDVSWVIDYPTGCEDWFNEVFIIQEQIDEMTALIWCKDDCFLEIPEKSKYRCLTVRRGLLEDKLFFDSWDLLEKVFAGSQKAPCPQVFDREFYSLLYQEEDVYKTILSGQDGSIVGVSVTMPISFVDFANIDKIAEQCEALERCYFTFDMAIVSEHRSYESFVVLARTTIAQLPQKASMTMDYSNNINPGFRSAFRRIFRLSEEQINKLGGQRYGFAKLDSIKSISF